jgi:Protein of unknown function (DUF1553)/Protein of unknown function (DUF1549)
MQTTLDGATSIEEVSTMPNAGRVALAVPRAATRPAWIRTAAALLSVAIAVPPVLAGEYDTASNAPHWAYQPVAHPAEPSVQHKHWERTPIDAFVLAKLEASGLTPSPDAERAAFVRRVTLDTWGVIPSPDEVKAFVSDRSPNAHERLVERLLASPRYGERWGRRWLDLTRYADSDGYNADGPRPNIWRYRDYVIKAFNEDKPYDRFLQEQLAGDELWPDSKEALIATGFLRSFPDEINARDLNLKKQEVANDLTDTVGAAVLGTTLNCAQCHNHKFDRISQKEYYQFQAFFANASWRDDIPAPGEKAWAEYQQRLTKYNEASKDVREQMEAILQPTIDKLESDRLSGFVPETRVSLMKSEEERTPYDRWIYHRNLWTMTGRTRNAVTRLKEKDKEGYAKYEKLEAELKKFDQLKPREPGYISAMTELGHADAPPTHVLFKGIYDRPLEEVQPGFPALFTDETPAIVPTPTSSGRRTALANWITNPKNPLTARVFVNRVWDQYFGRGIVETVSDFGKMGTKPSNPELLDYLADSFVKDGWSIKKLQRQILLSSVYRQSSAYRADVHAVDPENRLLAVFPRQRLDAEEIRDSLLAAAGLLEEKIGGPPVFPPLPPQAGITANAWKVSENPRDHNRRSVYIYVKRNQPYPLLDTFDWANPQVVHSRREVTTNAPQALALINSDLVYQWSQALAGRVVREAGGNEAAQVDRLYQVLFARTPDQFERATLLSFLDSQEKIAQELLTHGKKVSTPEGYGEDPQVRAQVEKLYGALYGRSPDRFEKADLLAYLDKQRKARAQGDDAYASDGEPITVPAVEAETPAARPGTGKRTPARAAAFLDLVHAVANSNEFSYRF